MVRILQTALCVRSSTKSMVFGETSAVQQKNVNLQTHHSLWLLHRFLYFPERSDSEFLRFLLTMVFQWLWLWLSQVVKSLASWFFKFTVLCGYCTDFHIFLNFPERSESDFYVFYSLWCFGDYDCDYQPDPTLTDNEIWNKGGIISNGYGWRTILASSSNNILLVKSTISVISIDSV